MTIKFKRKNRFLSLILALVLVFSMIPMTSMTVSAATPGEAADMMKILTPTTYNDGVTQYLKCDNYLYKATYTNYKYSDIVIRFFDNVSGKLLGLFRTESKYTALYKSNSWGEVNKVAKDDLPKNINGSASYYSESTTYAYDTTKPVVTITCIAVGNPTWTWDGTSSATAKFTSTDNGATLTVNASITSSTQAATSCVNKEKITYTAKATANGSEYTTTKTVDGAAGPHNLTYTASGNVITETCKNNCGYKQTAILKVKNGADLSYTGSAKEPLEVSYSSGWQGEKNASISYRENTEVGQGSGSITISGATATQNFTISQAQNSWTAEPNIDGWTYGETAKSPNKGTSKFGSDVKVEYKLATEDDSRYSTTVPTNAGSYKVRFSVEGNENYTALSKEVDLTIAKKKITVTAEDNSKTYGENDPVFTWKLTNGELVGTDELTGISVSRATGEDVKTYAITASQTDSANPNYDITFETGTFIINKKTIGISWGNTAFTYDGTTKYPTATATGMVFNDEIGLTVTGGQVNAGAGYVATVTGITGNKAGNYQLPVDVTMTFSIAKADQAAPGGLDYKPETIDQKADGYIRNLTTAMEYRKNDETDYTDITGTELNNLADGIYYIRYKKDSNHNASPETTIVLSNDTKLKVTVPKAQTGYTLTASNSELKWNESTTLTFALKEGYSKLENFAVKVNGNPVTLDEDGKYTKENVTENLTVTVEGVADITTPETEIALGENKWNKFFHSITFGLFFKDTQTVTITAEDKGSGVDKIYYYLSATELNEEQVKALSSDKWTEYTGAFNLNPQDEYIIYAKAVDKANNAKYISSDKTIIIDNIAPVVSGIADGETHYGDTTFTVADKHIDEVKVDGNPVTLTADGKYTITADGKQHTVVATDKSGNASVEIKITVMTIASLDDTIESITTDNVKSDDKKAEDFINKLPDNIANAGNSPATGDTGNLWMWFALALLSGGGLFGRKKKYSVK